MHESRHTNKMMCFPKLKRTGVNIINSAVIILLLSVCIVNVCLVYDILPESIQIRHC